MVSDWYSNQGMAFEQAARDAHAQDTPPPLERDGFRAWRERLAAEAAAKPIPAASSIPEEFALVIPFTDLMVNRLEANRSRGGWAQDEDIDLLVSAAKAAETLMHRILGHLTDSVSLSEVVVQAADVANYGAMLYERQFLSGRQLPLLEVQDLPQDLVPPSYEREVYPEAACKLCGDTGVTENGALCPNCIGS